MFIRAQDAHQSRAKVAHGLFAAGPYLDAPTHSPRRRSTADQLSQIVSRTSASARTVVTVIPTAPSHDQSFGIEHARHTPGQDPFLELNLTNESLKFDSISGAIPNRGLLQPDINTGLALIARHQSVTGSAYDGICGTKPHAH